MSSSEHCRRAIFQIYNVQNLKMTRITTSCICNVVYQAGSRWDPKCVFNFLRFFERTLYKSNYIIFILSWCGTHTKIRSKLVDIVTTGSQKKNTLWGPGILRVNLGVVLWTNRFGRGSERMWNKVDGRSMLLLLCNSHRSVGVSFVLRSVLEYSIRISYFILHAHSFFPMSVLPPECSKSSPVLPWYHLCSVL